MKQITAKLLIVFFEVIVLSNILCQAQLQLNEECTILYWNNTGICRFDDDCSLDQFIGEPELLEQVIFPTMCGYSNGKEIICCPKSNNTVTGFIEPEPEPDTIPMTDKKFSKSKNSFSTLGKLQK